MHWTDRIGRRLNPHDLHVFMAVVEQGNMARAADSLAISRPVVSRTIAGLEHALGVRLLDRSPQGVEPTLYGRALLKRSVAVFDELKQSVTDIESLGDPNSGQVRIGCTEPMAAGFVAAVIDRQSLKTVSVDQDSSGQSGGEKAKLAFTIPIVRVASILLVLTSFAYVIGWMYRQGVRRL